MQDNQFSEPSNGLSHIEKLGKLEDFIKFPQKKEKKKEIEGLVEEYGHIIQIWLLSTESTQRRAEKIEGLLKSQSGKIISAIPEIELENYLLEYLKLEDKSRYWIAINHILNSKCSGAVKLLFGSEVLQEGETTPIEFYLFCDTPKHVSTLNPYIKNTSPISKLLAFIGNEQVEPEFKLNFLPKFQQLINNQQIMFEELERGLQNINRPKLHHVKIQVLNSLRPSQGNPNGFFNQTPQNFNTATTTSSETTNTEFPKKRIRFIDSRYSSYSR